MEFPVNKCPKPLDVNKLIDYEAGNLPLGDSMKIEAHTKGCNHCRKELEDVKLFFSPQEPACGSEEYNEMSDAIVNEVVNEFFETMPKNNIIPLKVRLALSLKKLFASPISNHVLICVFILQLILFSVGFLPLFALVTGTAVLGLAWYFLKWKLHWIQRIDAFANNSNDAIKHIKIAQRHKRRKDFRRAHRRYKIALEISPDCWVADYNVGFCLMWLNDLKGAEEHFRALIKKLNHHHQGFSHRRVFLASCYCQLGNIFEQRERYKVARLYYRKSFKIMPEDTSNLQNLLLMTLKLRKFEESRRWYLQLVKLINREAIFKFLSNTASNDSQVEEFKLYIAKR